jgi:eukaryotic-like serine/threonine-protein kinase
MAMGSQPINVKGKCAQCGRALPADIAADICAPCELRGALELGAEPSEILSDESQGSGAFTAPALDTNPVRHEAADGFCQKRFGDYELLEEIARGGMGVVYRARQVSLNRTVAVKMLLAGRVAIKDFVQRFRTESAAAASLQHPNIVAIHEVGFAEGQHFFAMDFVEGLTLGQLAAQGPLPARHATRYLKAVAEAIHFAHERNVLHRDLKPSNVLIDSATDQPRVTDFGLAKRLEAETELTLSGQVLGSPNYMSPEQAVAKRGTIGKRSDVYSLGAILYHLLTGRPPFQGETLTDVLHQVVNDEPLKPHLLAPRLPRDLETICLKCLEKEPARRYQTAEELANELGRILSDEPIQARPVTGFEHAWRWCRRKPALASLSAALFLVFILGFGGTVWQWRQAGRHARGESQQLQRAEANGERADQSLYDSDMSLVQHAWDDADLGYARSRLQAHRRRTGETDRRDFEWFYFWKLCNGEQRMTLTNHTQPVNCVAFSPDGKRLATGSAGNPVRIWDTATGEIVKRLPEENVVSLAFSSDGQTLGVGGRDRVVVWNLKNEHIVFKLDEPLGQFRIAFPPKGTLVIIGRGALKPFVPANDGGTAELWDYAARELVRVFPESGGCIALSQGGDRLATGNTNQTIKIWDCSSGQCVRSVDSRKVIAMALSPDGQTLATSCWGAEVKLWNVSSGVQIGALTNNQHRVWSLAFSPDGSLLATGGADQMVRLWNVATRQPTKQLQGHSSEVMSVAFSTDGQTLASGGKDKTAMLWSVHPDRETTTVSNLISRAIFSPDSRLVAAGVGTNKVAVWDVATLREEAVFEGAHDALAFTSDSSGLITQGTNYFLRTFNVSARTVRATIPGRPAGETFFDALSLDQQILATGSTNGTLTFSDAKTGAVIATKEHAYAGSFFKLAFSPDGKLLATTGIPGELEAPAAQIWDTETAKRVEAPRGHTDLVIDVAFTPDGKTLLTGGVDDSIKFWDTTTWKEIPPSFGQKEYVSALAISPNGRRVATACSDGTMKLWNVATRRELATLKLDMYGFYITFSPDGQTLAAQDGDGLLRVWRAPFHSDKKQPRPPDR